MYRRNRRHKKFSNLAFAILCIVAIITLGTLLYINDKQEKEQQIKYEQIAREEREKQKKIEDQSNITLTQDNIAFLDDSEAEEVVSTERMIQIARFTSGYLNKASVNFSLDEIDVENYSDSDLNMLVFSAYSEKTAEAINVRIGTESSKYFISKEKSVFYLPISNLGKISISLDGDFQNTYIGDIGIYKMSNPDIRLCRYGQYNLGESKEFQLSNVDSTACRDLVISGDYNYVLFKNELRVQGKNDEVIGTLSGLGNTVHMCAVNEKTLAITARENDVYLVDVSDAANPKIVSTYDGMDLETGISSNGQYLFICSRYYGVEIVDISNINRPVTCSVVYTGGECIECAIEGSKLYISNWNLKKVFVFDVSNPNKPVELYNISTDGNPYGIEVVDNKIFVATGHHSAGNYTSVKSGGYGAGHGFEVYDISGEQATWISTSKIDGRLYYAADDSWGIYIDGNYAFLSSTYAGVFVYDISDISNPKRVGTAEVRIANGTDKYSYYESDRYIFPYNPEEYIDDTFAKIAFDDGTVYLAGQTTGLYKMPFAESMYLDTENRDTLEDNDGEYFTSFKEIKTYKLNSSVVTTKSCVNAICEYNGYVFLGCGDNGIDVRDIDGNELFSVDTSGPVQDLKIVGNYLYVAEGNYGIEVYSVDKNGQLQLANTYRCTLKNETVTQLNITPDGKNMLAQDGWTRLSVFRISASDGGLDLLERFTSGSMYFRNMINSDGVTDAIGYENSREVGIYTVNGTDLSEITTLSNSVYDERNGMCFYNNNLIVITGGGFVKVPIEQIKEMNDLNNLSVTTFGEDLKLKGKVIANDGVMVVNDPYDKKLTVIDITDLNDPHIVFSVKTSGNPDIAYISADRIFVPLKYQGYMIIYR